MTLNIIDSTHYCISLAHVIRSMIYGDVVARVTDTVDLMSIGYINKSYVTQPARCSGILFSVSFLTAGIQLFI